MVGLFSSITCVFPLDFNSCKFCSSSFGTDVHPSIFAFYYFPSVADTPAMRHATVTSHMTLVNLCNRWHRIAPPSLAPLLITPLDWLHVLNIDVIYGPHCYISLSWQVPMLFSDVISLFYFTDSPLWYPTVLLNYPTCPDMARLVLSHCTTQSSFLYLITCSFCTKEKRIEGKFTERRFCPSATVCPSVSVHSSPHLSVSAHCVWSSTCLPDHSCLCLQSPDCFCSSLHFHSPVYSCLLLHIQSTFLLPLHVHPICLLACPLAQQLLPTAQIAQLFPLTHPLLLTPTFLLTPWHPLNLPPASPHLCAASDRTSDHLSTVTCTSTHPSDPMHTPLSVHSCCASVSLF